MPPVVVSAEIDRPAAEVFACATDPARFRRWQKAGAAFALPGTLADRMTRCGYPGCRCHASPPQLHGPYHQWTRKKNGKTATRILADEQLADYQPWFDNHKQLRELIAELEELSLGTAETDPARTARQPKQVWAEPA